MTTPGPLVAPPVETPALFGLFSAARLLPIAGHDELGIRYEVVCDRPTRVWPGPCRTFPTQPENNLTVTLTFTGAQVGADFEVSVSATVSAGPPRALLIEFEGANFLITTGQGAVVIAHQADPIVGPAQYTDLDTGASGTVTVTQAADGSVVVA